MEQDNYRLYVLKLAEGKYYVGKTRNFLNRLQYHKEGTCEWTALYKPLDVVEVRRCNGDFDEEVTTKAYMRIYGIENVRGAQYTQKVLNFTQVTEILKSIECSQDLCFTCGKSGHFSEQCKIIPNRPVVAKMQSSETSHSTPAKTSQTTEVRNYSPKVVVTSRLTESSNMPSTSTRLTNSTKKPKKGTKDSPSKPKEDKLESKGKCVRCGRYGHIVEECYAATHFAGHTLPARNVTANSTGN